MTCGQVRGATAHFDAVVGAATSGVLGAAADSGVPVVFCVMTTDTMEQARLPNVLHLTLNPCLVSDVHFGGNAKSENARLGGHQAEMGSALYEVIKCPLLISLSGNNKVAVSSGILTHHQGCSLQLSPS